MNTIIIIRIIEGMVTARAIRKAVFISEELELEEFD